MPEASTTRVAIVDDDPSYGRAVARLLRASGVEALTFASAEEYLESGASAHPDCLLVDVHLGGMTGFDLQRRLDAAGLRPPIVFISGHTEGWIPERAAEAGCAFLRKSDPRDLLLGAIRRATAAPGATRNGSAPAPAVPPPPR